LHYPREADGRIVSGWSAIPKFAEATSAKLTQGSPPIMMIIGALKYPLAAQRYTAKWNEYNRSDDTRAKRRP